MRRRLYPEEQYPQGHLHLATSLNNLAALYADTGQYAQAEPLYRRALAIQEKALGPEPPDAAVTQPGALTLTAMVSPKYRTAPLPATESEPVWASAVGADSAIAAMRAATVFTSRA